MYHGLPWQPNRTRIHTIIERIDRADDAAVPQCPVRRIISSMVAVPVHINCT